MTDPTDPDQADRAWLRRQLDPIVDRPADDAWPTIRRRIDGDAAGPPAVEALAPRRTRGLAALGIAAAVLALVGLAVVVAVEGDEPTTTVTAEPAAATGWYAPAPLPDGWSLTGAWIVDPPDGVCPGFRQRWVDDERPEVTLLVSFTTCDPATQTAPHTPIDEQFDLPAEEGPVALAWEADGGWWALEAVGLAQDDLEEAKGQIEEDPPAVKEASVDLIGLRPHSVTVGSGAPATPEVRIEVRTDDGYRVVYSLAPPGSRPGATTFDTVQPIAIDGQALPLERWSPTRPRGVEGAPSAKVAALACCADQYVGRWPGADVQLDTRHAMLTTGIEDPGGGDPGAMEDWAERGTALSEQLLGTLRARTTDEWRTFLAGASGEVDPRLLSVDRLAGLDPGADADGAAPDRPSVDDSPATPTSAPTTAPGSGDSEDHDEPVTTTSVPAPDPATLTPVEDLRALGLRLELDGPVDAIGYTPGTLVAHNPTDRPMQISWCTLTRMRWAVVPLDEVLGEVPDLHPTACRDMDPLTIQPGATARRLLDRRFLHGFTARSVLQIPEARFGAPLPAGTYAAVVVLPGAGGEERVSTSIEVGEPACPFTDGDALFAYGLDGTPSSTPNTTVVEVDGTRDPQEPTDVDCDRVRLRISNSRTVDYTRG